MGSPQFTDQLRKAPTQAFRAVFAGIGRIILAADRARAELARAGGQHERPPAPRLTTAQRRLADTTGNVRLLSAEEAGDEAPVRAAPEITVDPPASRPLSGNVPIGASLVVHELPLAGYDSLSLASIRARLRTLDVSQLQALLVYERKHADRPDVVAMIERRIEKIESGG